MVKSLEEPQSQSTAALSTIMQDMDLHPAIASLINAALNRENGHARREFRDFPPTQEGEGKAIYIKYLAHQAVDTLLDESLTEA